MERNGAQRTVFTDTALNINSLVYKALEGEWGKLMIRVCFGKEIEIVKYDDGKLELKQDALDGILRHPDIGNRPVSIISIAGPFRTGKSFMLNFLLRFIRNEGYKNCNWLGTEDTPLHDGFTWQGGDERITTGIKAWSEPLIVKKDGKEVAILLFDTQGAFDNDSDTSDCMKIFTISLMMSSVLIYNLKNQIQGDNLAYLEYFIDYASRATKEFKKDPSQKLLFLVRDWEKPKSSKYGNVDAKKYLAKILSKNKDLTKSFKEISCYLMPLPGPGTQIYDDKPYDGRLGDIDVKFREHLTPLAASLLHPDNLVTKTQTGKVLNNIIISCWENMDSFEDPKAVNLMYQEHHCLEKLFDCKNFFDQKAVELLSSKEEDVDKKLSDARREALQLFEISCEGFDQEIVMKRKRNLSLQINNSERQFNLRKDLAKVDEKEKKASLLEKIKDRYISRTDEEREEFRTDSKTAHDKVKKELEEKFLPDIGFKGTKSEVDKVFSEIDELFQMLEEDRNFEQRQNFNKAKMAAILAARRYEERLKKDIDQQDKNELAINYEPALEECNKIFEANIPKGLDYKKCGEEMRDKLIQQTEIYIDYLSDIHQKKFDDPEIYNIWLSYNNFMGLDSDGKVVKESYITTKTCSFNESLLNIFEAFNLPQSTLNKWNQHVQDIYDALVTRNDYLQAVFEVELQSHGYSMIKELHQELKEHEKESFFELEKWLGELKLVYGIKYNEKMHQLFSLGLNMKISREYLKDIELAFVNARKINRKNQESIEIQLEQSFIKDQILYCEHMEEKMSGAYISPEVLEEVHRDQMKRICQSWEDLVEGLESKGADILTTSRMKNQIAKLKDKFENLFTKFKEFNGENKTLFRRIIGGVSGLAGAVGGAGGAVGGLILASEVTSITATVAIASATGVGAAIVVGISVAALGTWIGRQYLKTKDKEFFSRTRQNINHNEDENQDETENNTDQG